MDFPPEWYETHPEIEGMKKSALLALLAEHGALIIHAHPFHQNRFIDHIRLYPNLVHGVEIYNACETTVPTKWPSFMQGITD